MAVGIRNAILNLILVLFAGRTIFGDTNTNDLTHKVRRDTGGSSGNSNHWTKNDNIDKLRQEIFASLPADLPGILLKSQTLEGQKGDHTDDLSPLEQVGNVAGLESANDARENMALYNYLSRQPARNIYQEGLDKRNGFFFGKRNGFFFGKRDTDAAESHSCVSCGPQNSGQCVMFGTCCSLEFGCYVMTEESKACMTHHVSTGCWDLDHELPPTCGGRRGVCVAEGICCSPQDGACKIDLSCRSAQTKTID